MLSKLIEITSDTLADEGLETEVGQLVSMFIGAMPSSTETKAESGKSETISLLEKAGRTRDQPSTIWTRHCPCEAMTGRKGKLAS